jgi:hypothetical protein
MQGMLCKYCMYYLSGYLGILIECFAEVKGCFPVVMLNFFLIQARPFLVNIVFSRSLSRKTCWYERKA